MITPLIPTSNIKINYKNRLNGLDLLSNLNDACIKTAFFDPQYRGILDKLQYGNEGVNRGKARHDLTQMTENVICDFINELNRVITSSGHLFIYG